MYYSIKTKNIIQVGLSIVKLVRLYSTVAYFINSCTEQQVVCKDWQSKLSWEALFQKITLLKHIRIIPKWKKKEQQWPLVLGEHLGRTANVQPLIVEKRRKVSQMSRCSRLLTTGNIRTAAEKNEVGLAKSIGNMAAKALRQRTRRGSRQDANNVNVPTEARPQKEEKGGDDSKITDTRQEWVLWRRTDIRLPCAVRSILGLTDSLSRRS